MSGIPFGWALQRYWPSVVFPAITVWAIYADWSHTREWKNSLKLKNVDDMAKVSG